MPPEHTLASPRRLEWEEDDLPKLDKLVLVDDVLRGRAYQELSKTEQEVVDGLRAGRQPGLKIAPPRFDCRVIDYQDGKPLTWD
jgi:hypothetical protein